MKAFLLVLAAALAVADKTCTPSFDYCADTLLAKKGFVESDLRAALQGTGFENATFDDVLFHCTNPGQIGHAKLCSSGCTESATEGSHGC
ncbi:hypothetical protein ASPZODRAFT_90221 [Penicilliopsis zonata CBS 506.65]|uniref:Uncharacterized protein n=1 Tax=Penicilliopsis zonata CBS 506.65 TaxID=1073090 RepID=A0A1L9ST28_9EURO|nr:hypothetical protein ASPZODRAFT_90221 [Penicilliopsis zonata CBS 506.65]OJJ50244.1 hypothetical protein ASPZODRAFT_90221 [Penicilliopsis zonata CBS 506.65]